MKQIKNINHIDCTFPIMPIILNKEKINLFFNQQEKVFYSLYTDGDIEHFDTWIDKKPYDRDDFLIGCSQAKRFEFYLTNANILLIEKHYQTKMAYHLYMDQDHLYKIANNQLYQISISEKEKLIIKKMER